MNNTLGKKFKEDFLKLEESFFKKYPEERERHKEIVSIMDAAIIGNIIKQARFKNNMTQDKLANLVNLDRSQISRLETNVSITNMQTLLKIFNVLNIKMELTIH